MLFVGQIPCSGAPPSGAPEHATTSVKILKKFVRENLGIFNFGVGQKIVHNITRCRAPSESEDKEDFGIFYLGVGQKIAQNVSSFALCFAFFWSSGAPLREAAPELRKTGAPKFGAPAHIH